MSTSSTRSRCERWRAMISVDVVFPTPPLLWATATTTGAAITPGRALSIVSFTVTTINGHGERQIVLSARVTVGTIPSLPTRYGVERRLLVTIAPHPGLGIP